MSADIDPDFLATLRAAEAQAKANRRSRKAQRMSRESKEALLRRRGWRRTSTSGSQQWQKDGRSYTLSGAVAVELAKR
jgi:hypothetical protein